MNTSAQPRPSVVVGLRLLRLVGSGGEGEVWEARDELGRRRALKLIRPDALAPDAEARSRHLLAIDHPALVRVYRGGRLQGGALDGWGFLEMEYIDGPSLQDAPADPAVLDRLWPLAEALDLLHSGEWTHGLPLVHRDVKPANLVEDADGELVLVDPSTLRGLDATDLTRIGTPVFSAPEVLTGRFGPPADVYSFAVTVVALLTGARGAQLAELVDAASNMDLPDGVAFALSPVPADRPVSCRAVLEAGTVLADDPTLLLPSPVDPDAHRPPAHDHRRSGPVVHDGDIAPRRRRLWPWAWLFVLLVGVSLAALATDLLPDDRVMVAIAAAAAVHIVAGVVGTRSLGLTVLCPPVAWAVLLGRRVSGGRRRRAWACAVLTGAMLPAVVAIGCALANGFELHRATVAAGAAATVVVVLVCVALADAEGPAAVIGRLVLTPLWVAGGAVLVVGGGVLSLFGMARGTVWSTLTSLADGIRGPAMMR